ncbi:hypothetical protein TNCV_2165731 [Trichonephila clavipes]|nr:hypothetical protein TNCV_2165731 [Trichonephila clavipes]
MDSQQLDPGCYFLDAASQTDSIVSSTTNLGSRMPWLARSPDLSPIQSFLFMIAELLTLHHMPVTTVDELWNHVEAA